METIQKQANVTHYPNYISLAPDSFSFNPLSKILFFHGAKHKVIKVQNYFQREEGLRIFPHQSSRFLSIPKFTHTPTPRNVMTFRIPRKRIQNFYWIDKNGPQFWHNFNLRSCVLQFNVDAKTVLEIGNNDDTIVRDVESAMQLFMIRQEKRRSNGEFIWRDVQTFYGDITHADANQNRVSEIVLFDLRSPRMTRSLLRKPSINNRLDLLRPLQLSENYTVWTDSEYINLLDIRKWGLVRQVCYNLDPAIRCRKILLYKPFVLTVWERSGIEQFVAIQDIEQYTSITHPLTWNLHPCHVGETPKLKFETYGTDLVIWRPRRFCQILQGTS
jgi:hypothetical protein